MHCRSQNLKSVLRHLATNCNCFQMLLYYEPLSDSRLKYFELFGVFLGVAETIVGSLLCCGFGYSSVSRQSFVWHHLVIAPICNTKKPPIFPSKSQIWGAERWSCSKCVYLHIFCWLALIKYLLQRYTCLLATTVVYCSFCSNQSFVWAD